MHPALLATRDWLDRVVVGLNLCPFAKAPLRSGAVRFALCDSAEPGEALMMMMQEIETLRAPNGPATTLLVLPQLQGDFEDFLDLVEAALDLIDQAGLDRFAQLAHFHPDYRFDGEPPSDPANQSNRSPHPTLHLLRWQDVRTASETHPDPEGIPQRNIQRLRALGNPAIEALKRG